MPLAASSRKIDRMSNPDFDVFVSYSNEDLEFATRLIEALRNQGCTVFSDRNLSVGDDWVRTTQRALAASKFVLVLLSQSYFESPLLSNQWQDGMERERNEKRVVVLPAVLENCNVPPALASKVPLDFRRPEDSEQFTAGLNKLIGAIGQWSSVPSRSPSGSSSPLTLPPAIVPTDLIQSCVAGECVLFAGAGLSARAGVSTWTQLLRDLLQFARQHNVIDSSYSLSLSAALDEGERDAAADGIVQMFADHRELVQSFLQEYFMSAGPISFAHRLLKQTKFASIITTNYDRLLEETFPEYAEDGLFTPKDAEPLLDALAQKRRFILKLYGIIERLETLIFAPIEYRESLSSNISFSKFMEGIFFSRSFFFVGLSIEGIQDFLAGFVFRGTSPRRHFALVAVTGPAWEAKARLLRNRYNIEVIPIPPSETYPEVETFLEGLCDAIRQQTSDEGDRSAQPPSMPGVRRLVLEDIGPFERLELDFPKEHKWKVLLGDNGVGKSTILKAIAVAILGTDAKSFAARLVRTGKTKGRIILFTEQNPSGYITEILTKDVISEAEIVSLPSRPMEAEGWLALGFSPLRVVTWAGSTGPQPIIQKGRPTADDLLPLLSGESDPRMDRLKQWIVNLDSADKPGRTRSLLGHAGVVSKILFTPDGRTLISGSFDGTVRFWDCWSERETRRISQHTGGVNFLALSKNGKVLASGSYDHSAKTWDATSGDPIESFMGGQSQILSVALSADGATLITASESGLIRIWETNGRERSKFRSIGGKVWCLALSPDDKVVAAGTNSGTIDLHDIFSGKFVRSIEVGRGTVMGLVWSPDGKNLVCGSRNGPVEVFDAATGQQVTVFAAADTRTVAISPDGNVIAAGFESGEIKAWDLGSRKELMQVQAHSKAVRSVALSTDGKTLASASEDRTIKLWNLPGSVQNGNQQETIRRFFELVRVLMDRKDIDYLGVTKNYRVMVKVTGVTDGLPLELLSQGMTSLLGWTGVLCQRLKETLEIPTQDPLPTKSYALVLIDELDAHMHPKWQQVLVRRLKKAFPNVQFVACTHSPLIIGGLADGEVERFIIKKDKIVKVNFDADMTLGRTDQILTGELFGLETTLDAETQEVVAEYKKLLGLGKQRRDKDQEERFMKLNVLLEARIPLSPSNLIERRAAELLHALQSDDSEEKERGVKERMSQLAKALGGDK
jgi:WD40 repeat protein